MVFDDVHRDLGDATAGFYFKVENTASVTIFSLYWNSQTTHCVSIHSTIKSTDSVL